MEAGEVWPGPDPFLRAEIVRSSERTRITRLFLLPSPGGPRGTCRRTAPEPVEVSAYYIVAEALTDAAKHARASTVGVEPEVVGDLLRVTVRDDGAGGADLARGTGLAGLKDRVEALGGRIVLHSPGGAGTSLRAELPLSATSDGVASR
jgi:signal transduction histidine kinase